MSPLEGSTGTEYRAQVIKDLRGLIRKSGLTQRAVAERMGVSEAALSRQLSGRANLTLDSLYAICQACGGWFAVVFWEGPKP